MKSVNDDPKFEYISKATFPTLPYAQRLRLDCDLYELDSALMDKIQLGILEQDSLVMLDTTLVREDTFLEKLYKRKVKMHQRAMQRDSLARLEDVIRIKEGG
jgi:hypothetical protein